MYNLYWKKIFFALGFITIGLSGFSQHREINLADHDNKPYYFGISLAYNTNRFHFDQHPRFLQYDSVMVAEPLNSGGFGLGLSATLPLTKRFEARTNPQLLFTERAIQYFLTYPDGTKDELPLTTRSVQSVTVYFPFQMKFNSDRIGNFRVYMLGGVKADYDLASNARARQAEDLLKVKKTDFGIEAGIGFNFYFQHFILSPELKISNGIGNIHSRDESLKYSNVIEQMRSRMVMFTLHIEG